MVCIREFLFSTGKQEETDEPVASKQDVPKLSHVRLKAKGEILAFFPQLGIPVLYEDIPILL